MLVVSRDGQPENALREVVRCCQRLLPEKGSVKPTQLFSKNAEVDRVNTAELAGLAQPQARPHSSHECYECRVLEHSASLYATPEIYYMLLQSSVPVLESNLTLAGKTLSCTPKFVLLPG